MKICPRCKKEKTNEDFSKDKNRKDKLKVYCKLCDKEISKEYYKNNKGEILKRNKQWRIGNEEKQKIQTRKYYDNNKEKLSVYYREYNRQWRELNKDWVREYNKEYEKNRIQIDEQYAIKKRLRSLLRQSFKKYSLNGKCGSSKKYGIDYQAICEHLGPCPGHREDYHIDHIRPLCSFDFNDSSQVREAFAPENHQWLKAQENLKKNNKLNNTLMEKYYDKA